MREVLYRAWDLDNKVMIYPSPVDSFLKTMTWHGRVYKDGRLLNYIMLPWTGMRDKNDKRIFEGDIIKDDYHGISEVFYKNGSVKINGRYSVVSFGAYSKKTEIIGNVYENKELLKGE